jgi:hypothetical protein
MATVKIHQMGGLIQHKTQGKGIFLKITERKGKVFSSKSLTNNSTNASKKSAITRSG